jgi:predicted transposase/invertase (TIGR01784 family)
MPHPIIFTPEDDIIDICRDNVFKTTFVRAVPSSQGALKRLLSALIGQPVEVLSVAANEPPVVGLGDRQIRYDILVKFDRGKLANIEITLNPRSDEILRIEYYTARLYASQEIRGAEKNFGDLTDTYQISLVGGKRLFDDEEPIHRFEYYDREREMSCGGRTRIIVVELEKAQGLLRKPVEGMSPAERWTVFFRYVTETGKRELINEILAYEEGIAMAGEVLLTISRDEEERARLESEFKYELDRQCELVDARREGLAEGRAEGEIIGLEKGRSEGEIIGLEKGEIIGREKGRSEGELAGLEKAARRLRALGMSADQIAQVTGLDP